MITISLEQIDQSLYNTKQTIQISEVYFEIGRSENCEIVLPDYMDYISKRHMSFTIKKNQVWLEHLGSNPSFLNGEVINEEKEVFHGDIIKLTTLGPQFKISIFNDEAQSAIVKFFRSKQVIWFYLALLAWILITILYFYL